MAAREGPFRFEGFSSPNGTIVPDEFFDILAPELSEAELRVCLYLIRRTLGFKKNSDEVSFRQMVDGIRTKDGRVLDRGAGVVKSAAARAAKGLVEKGVVIAVRNASAEKGHEPTTYALRFRGTERESGRVDETAGRTPLSSRRTRVVLQKDTPLSSKRTHKKQYLQETESSNGDQHSTAKSSTGTDESQRVDDVIDELTLALGDTAHAASNRSQARSLYAQSGMPPEQFAARMYEALAVTKDRARDGDVGTKAAYFFAVLRDLLGLRERRERRAHSEGDERQPVTVHPPIPQPPTRRTSRPIPGSTLTTDDAWDRALELLAAELSAATLRTYFAHSALIEVRERSAVISVANGYVAAQVDQRFRSLVRRALAAVLARPVTVSFVAATAAPPHREEARL